MRKKFTIAMLATLLTGCSTAERNDATPQATANNQPQADSAGMVTSTPGFIEPEAVRYDPDQDVYFVSNWGSGAPDAKDNNGFISRMSPDGAVDSPHFIAGGTRGVTLHSPRGMTISGDTLWAVDMDAVRGFHRRTGASLATVPFSAFRLGFLNDIAAGPDGLYVTDTGTDHIYRISGGKVTIALADSTLGDPNGITWDAAHNRFVLVPFGGDSVIRAWTPGTRDLVEIAKVRGAQLDGVEILSGDRLLIASQSDSSVYLVTGKTGQPIIRTGGTPADIGVDTKRNRVALPFVDRNLVEIWQLPPR